MFFFFKHTSGAFIGTARFTYVLIMYYLHPPAHIPIPATPLVGTGNMEMMSQATQQAKKYL